VRGDGREQSELHWERACLLRAQRGDAAAFAELYRAFAPRLYRDVLLPKLGQAQAAEDALSETFRTLMEHIATLDADGRSLWPWLCRVATNKALDMHRNKARSRRALVNFESLLAPLAPAPESGDAGADSRHDRAELRSTIVRVLEALSPRYRRAIELRFLEDQARERCALLMEVKLGTFDVLLLRALRAFRREWEARLVPAEEDVG
jgi:RNA polymerase sigma-70 factor (ECF subfamily)